MQGGLLRFQKRAKMRAQQPNNFFSFEERLTAKYTVGYAVHT